MDEIPEEFKEGEMITQVKEKFSGEKKIETYIKGEKIGTGGFSTCYKLYNVQDKKIYAAKEIIKNTNVLEISPLKALNLLYELKEKLHNTTYSSFNSPS